MPDDPASRPLRGTWTASESLAGEPARTGERAAVAPAAAQTGQGSLPNKWAAFLVIAIGIFMSTLDSSIVNISLPTIAGHFHVALNGTIPATLLRRRGLPCLQERRRASRGHAAFLRLRRQPDDDGCNVAARTP